MLSVSEETFFRGVAQLASASGLGPEGPVFESQYPDIDEDGDFSRPRLFYKLIEHRYPLSEGLVRPMGVLPGRHPS